MWGGGVVDVPSRGTADVGGATNCGVTGTCPDAPVCGFFKGALERLPPDVLIVLDRSGSMEGEVIRPGSTWACSSPVSCWEIVP